MQTLRAEQETGGDDKDRKNEQKETKKQELKQVSVTQNSGKIKPKPITERQTKRQMEEQEFAP